MEKLWSYFIPVPPGRKTRRALQRLYVRGRYEVRPVVEAILRHPALYEGPRMVKPPVVYLAGLLRGMGGASTPSPGRGCRRLMRQRLFVPPNVAGWDDDRWLDTGTWRARWIAAPRLRERELDPTKPYDEPASRRDRRRPRARVLGQPDGVGATRARCSAFAQRVAAAATSPGSEELLPILRQNALRMLVATSPDLQTS